MKPPIEGTIKEIKEFRDDMFIIFSYDGRTLINVKKIPAILREVKYRFNENEIAVTREIYDKFDKLLDRYVIYTMTIGEFIEIEQRKFASKKLDLRVIRKAALKAVELLP